MLSNRRGDSFPGTNLTCLSKEAMGLKSQDTVRPFRVFILFWGGGFFIWKNIKQYPDSSQFSFSHPHRRFTLFSGVLDMWTLQPLFGGGGSYRPWETVVPGRGGALTPFLSPLG